MGAPVSKVTGEKVGWKVGCGVGAGEFVGDLVNGLIREDRSDEPLLLDVAPLPFFLVFFFPGAGEIEGALSLNEDLLESPLFFLLEALDDGDECSFVGAGVAVGCALSSSLLLESIFFLNFFLFSKIETFVDSAVSSSLSISHTLWPPFPLFFNHVFKDPDRLPLLLCFVLSFVDCATFIWPFGLGALVTLLGLVFSHLLFSCFVCFLLSLSLDPVTI